MPRRTSQLSNGPGIPPPAVRQSRRSRGQIRVPGDDRAAEHVRVPGDRLGQRVHRGHRAELQRLLQQRRRDRVVHHERCPGRRGQRAERRQVGDPQQRVGRRLRPQHARARRAAPARPRRGRAGRPPRPRPRAAAACPPAPACCSSRRAGTRSCSRPPPAPASAPSTPPAPRRTSPRRAPGPSIAASASSTAVHPGLPIRPYPRPAPARPATRTCWSRAAAAQAAPPPPARSPHAPAAPQR